MRRLPETLSLSLHLVVGVAFATLLRSVLFERWTTVFAAGLLIVGAHAALRAHTWGVGLVLAVAAAFPTAAVLGFAPGWFWLVGLTGAIPFVLALRPMARFDAGATALFALLAGGAGVACAFAWREAAIGLYFALHACH